MAFARFPIFGSGAGLYRYRMQKNVRSTMEIKEGNTLSLEGLARLSGRGRTLAPGVRGRGATTSMQA